jgi:hypothetical protein
MGFNSLRSKHSSVVDSIPRNSSVLTKVNAGLFAFVPHPWGVLYHPNKHASAVNN